MVYKVVYHHDHDHSSDIIWYTCLVSMQIVHFIISTYDMGSLYGTQ